MDLDSVYAAPRTITDIDDCYFYHSMEIPGYGLVEGEWDLRKYVHDYLGGINFRGKRVLEVGTASGFLCFEMEKAGAEVVAFDLSDEFSWDIVPFARFGADDLDQHITDRKAHIRKLNNGWWFSHRAFQSQAKVVYGTLYAVPKEIGGVDVGIFSSVLLHVRDPFLALLSGLSLTRETALITEKVRGKRWIFEIARKLGLPFMSFLPEHSACQPMETWWNLSPDILRKMLRVLGFENTTTKYFEVEREGRKELMFTIVGQRTAGSSLVV